MFEGFFFFYHAGRGEEEKYFARETGEREDSGVCLLISYSYLLYFILIVAQQGISGP